MDNSAFHDHTARSNAAQRTPDRQCRNPSRLSPCLHQFSRWPVSCTAPSHRRCRPAFVPGVAERESISVCRSAAAVRWHSNDMTSISSSSAPHQMRPTPADNLSIHCQLQTTIPTPRNPFARHARTETSVVQADKKASCSDERNACKSLACSPRGQVVTPPNEQ